MTTDRLLLHGRIKMFLYKYWVDLVREYIRFYPKYVVDRMQLCMPITNFVRKTSRYSDIRTYIVITSELTYYNSKQILSFYALGKWVQVSNKSKRIKRKYVSHSWMVLHKIKDNIWSFLSDIIINLD